MMIRAAFLCAILVLQCGGLAGGLPGGLVVVPEDVGTAFAAIYGFSPRIVIGRDHRVGFGFRLGNHADLQLLYELGPQTATASLRTATRVRSALYHQHQHQHHQQRARRRPFVELLLRAGVLLSASPDHTTRRHLDDEPR